MYDFQKQELSWSKLMEEMSKRSNNEFSDMSLVSMKSTSNSRSPIQRSSTPAANTTEKAPGPTRFICAACDYSHPPHYKWCEQCKQHEGEKWFWCQICRKHHSSQYSKCSLYVKPTASAATTGNRGNNRDTSLVRASAGVLDTTTGLPRGTTPIHRIAGMAILPDMFEKRYIDRHSVLLDSSCFNHLFNSKK